MRRLAGVVALAAMCGLGATGRAMVPPTAAGGVQVVPNESEHRVDVTIDGQPFTSYLWATNQRKPVLYPLVAPDGTTVTRGYPFHLRPGERVDHPHHAGLWFNYGNANGFDFWNNSDAIKPEERSKYGTIHHDRIVSIASGADKGDLVVESTWTTAAGSDILRQTTRYVFSRGTGERTVDLIVTLKALDRVVFHDDKEGLLGIRVAHFLESPTEKGGVFNDANGVATKVEAADTRGATGVYRTSEGKTGDEAWSTRGRWCTLTGSTNGKTETIAIFDHKGNPGYPAYWHARGYGLFAVNPLGAHVFDAKAAQMDFTMEKGKTETFAYRVRLMSHAASVEDMNVAADGFEGEYR